MSNVVCRGRFEAMIQCCNVYRSAAMLMTSQLYMVLASMGFCFKKNFALLYDCVHVLLVERQCVQLVSL